MIHQKKIGHLLIYFLLTTFISFNASGAISDAIKKGQQIFFNGEHGDYRDLTKIAKILIDEGVYFAAIPFLKEAIYTKPDTIDKSFDKTLDKLIFEVGRDQFSSLEFKTLAKSNAPSVQMVVASKYYRQKKYDKAIKHLDMINKKSNVYSSALMLKAHLLSKKKEFKKSIKTYRRCIKYAEKARSKFDDIEHLERSFQFIKDSCIVSVARVLYKAERFVESSNYYRAIPKTSYKWPSILLEDAWNSYRLKDYNRSIGRLLTFRSPILENYFFPESEVLKAMGYLELCLWDDAIEVIKYYQKVYAPGGQKLVKLLKANRSNAQLYVRLSLNEKHKEFKNFPFLKNSIEYIKARPYFLSSIYHLKSFSKEYRIFKTSLKKYRMRKRKRKSKKRSKSYKFAKILLYNLKESKNNQIALVNQYVKKSLFNIANEVGRTSGELLAIHLESFSRKKNQIFATKDIMSKEKGNLKDIDREVTQYFWSFEHEFWADELGDYVLAVESECTEKDKARNAEASKEEV